MTNHALKTEAGKRLLDPVCIVLLAAAAFFLTIYAGQRGFMPFDQSIVFDGGYRILRGQTPYKDFVTPYGIILFCLQAVAFGLLGVTYKTYIVTAALMNAAAAICALSIIRLLFPDRRAYSYLAAAITGVWFYPPLGTPWAEQTAFLLILFSLAAALYGLERASPDRKFSVWIFLSGCFAFGSLLAKQNAGLLFLPAAALAIT